MHVNHGFSTKFLDRHWNESGTVWLFDILLDELQIHLYFVSFSLRNSFKPPKWMQWLQGNLRASFFLIILNFDFFLLMKRL